MEEMRLRGLVMNTGKWKYWTIDGKVPVTVDLEGVNLDTVGRYIGKKDSHNNHIYEGDILEDCHGNSGVVMWSRKRLSFECISVRFMDQCRIIGNIYEADKERIRLRKILERDISKNDLSTRSYNSLKALGVEKLCDVVKYRKEELAKARNIGEKSMMEIEKMLRNMNLSFGMDIAIFGFRTK